ncbi:MAG: hypothetical protein GY753_09780 [Gammaproteobacteria bacterium]|nr:hypothetical protein [Gammaproteobacteria bacterium]
MAHNSARQKDVKIAEKRVAFETAIEVAGMTATMRSKEGRAFIAWILQESALEERAFTGNSTTFFNNGKQEVGMVLLDRIKNHCFSDYQQMERESRLKKEISNE